MLTASHEPHAKSGAVQNKPSRHQSDDRHNDEPVQGQGAYLEGEIQIVQHFIGIGIVRDFRGVRTVDTLGNHHCQCRGQQIQSCAANGLIRLQIDGGERQQ